MQDDKTGLIEKYMVLKLQGDDAEDEADCEVCDLTADRYPSITEGWYKNSWCFVLSPEKDDDYGEASRLAMERYAEHIAAKNPTLAKDIREKLKEIGKRLHP